MSRLPNSTIGPYFNLVYQAVPWVLETSDMNKCSHTQIKTNGVNLVEVSSIEKDRLWILFPYFLLPLVNARNSTEAVGTVLEFSIFHLYFASAGSSTGLFSTVGALVVTTVSGGIHPLHHPVSLFAQKVISVVTFPKYAYMLLFKQCNAV